MNLFLKTILFAYFAYNPVKGDSRLVGGSVVSSDLGRFHASLQNVSGHHVCGGAIVSNRHVVTAAHCVFGAEKQYIRVIVGTNNLDEGTLQHNVKAIYIHDLYDKDTRQHDIALLKVTDIDIRYSDVIHLDDTPLQENDPITIFGFGAEKPHGTSTRQMQALNSFVFNQETCRYAMRNSRKVYDSMFCTFTKIGQGTCHGDSGSPLVRGNKLVGIVSWGMPCAIGFPDVHTRISTYVRWIRTMIHYCPAS
ncbi:chymotrypsin-1-like [Leptidea sinapis]|uniref:chymotrypsin-1-like n=1 Tax=Leptidea sinapis TaxID=189913 RepID=UPI0021464533|nr:chymotrypsin-1-like [Leptidea sinapis]